MPLLPLLQLLQLLKKVASKTFKKIASNVFATAFFEKAVKSR